jgi:hypothetical protein
MYNNRPAKITVRIPEDVQDGESVELTADNVVDIEYLDETFKKAFAPKVQRRIMNEISEGVPVQRIPRKAKKKLKSSVGIPNRHGKVKLVRNTIVKTALGYELQIRRSR